jgi:hypothetical protein
MNSSKKAQEYFAVSVNKLKNYTALLKIISK